MYVYVYACAYACACAYAYVYLYVYVYESWFFIKCTVCLNQYQPSYFGGVFPANVSMGHRKTIQDGQAKGVDHYCGTTKALACTSKSYRMIAILDAIMMVSSTADHALKEIAAAHIHPCKSPLTSRFTIFIPFIPILQNFPVKFNTGPPCGWDPFSWPQKCASPFLPCPQSPLKWLPTARYWWYVRYRWRRAKLCILRQACSGKLGNSTSQCSRMHDDYPRVS